MDNQKLREKKWDVKDVEFMNKIVSVEESTNVCLRNDFDTPGALEQLRRMMKETNVYMNAGDSAKVGAISEASAVVSKYLGILGINCANAPSNYAVEGYGDGKMTKTNSLSDLNQVLDILTKFRADVRQSMRGENAKKEIFDLCDRLRDVDMPAMKVKIEDRKDGSIWKRIET